MKYAAYTPNVGSFGNPSTLIELAREAEEANWDGFFIWDHLLWTHPQNSRTLDPWVALGGIAAVTHRIKLGALVTPIPRRHPWKLAREIVTLDHLSGGRAVLGVGIGHDMFKEYSAVGDLPNKYLRGEMLDEGLEVITGLWSGQPFSYEGKHYRITDAEFLPAPVQQPRIPIWVAAMWPYKPPLRRSARWDGVVPIGTTAPLSPEDIRTISDYIKDHRTATTPFDIVGGPTELVGNPRAADIAREYEEAGLTWWLEYFGGEDEIPFEQLREGIRSGPPIKRSNSG